MGANNVCVFLGVVTQEGATRNGKGPVKAEIRVKRLVSAYANGNGNNKEQQDSDTIRIEAWKGREQNAGKGLGDQLVKLGLGSVVQVRGELQTPRYQAENGQARATWTVVVRELMVLTAKERKEPEPQPDAGSGGGGGDMDLDL